MASRDEIIGLRAYEIAHKSDGGTEMWRAVSAARDQLQQVITHITGTEALEQVFVFGGCLAFGIWDGQSDVDFSVLDVEKWTSTKETSRALEERRVEQVDNALQVIGFPRSALTRLQGTRVPIVKHKTATKGRSALKALPYTQCLVRFNRRVQELEPTALLAAVNARDLTLDGAPKWSDDERGETFREVAFRLMSTDDVIAFTLAVPWDADGYNCTHRIPSYQRPPELSTVDFDVSFRGFGVRNSWLLRFYLMQHRCARMGAIVIKKWAKTVGMSDSRNGFLTSYAMVIMWIHYLLQKGLITEFTDPESVPTVPRDAQDLKGLYRPLVAPDTDLPDLQLELGITLFGFFLYYSEEFDWEGDAVSLNRPGVTTKDYLKWTEANQVATAERVQDRVWYLMAIEDPYEPNFNLGRHISKDKLSRILKLFREAVLSLGTIDRHDAVPCHVFVKPTQPTLAQAYAAILKECAKYIVPEGIAIDILHNNILGAVYPEWAVTTSKYEKLSNFLRDHGQRMCRVEDRIVFPPPPRIGRGAEVVRSFKQMCMECNMTFMKLYKSDNPTKDPGLYCDSCWIKFEK